MGCASSKPNHTKCKHCKAPYSPVTRSYSMHVHHPPSKDGDPYHVVALTSSTLGSIRLDSTPSPQSNDHFHDKNTDDGDCLKKKAEFEVGMIEAKAWSKMIDEKITKVAPMTPIRTPPGEPETINAWEMMEGLEDISPLRPGDHDHNHIRSFSFHVSPNEVPDWMDEQDDCPSKGNLISKAIESELDPDVISAFRKAFEELSPSHPFRLSKQQIKTQHENAKSNGTVPPPQIKQNAVKEKLVLYFTSLRGVRKTYEDCCNVRLILKGLSLKVDERDVSMHSGFRDELKQLLGEKYKGGLPQVFVGNKYIGGAEEIQTMHEDGRLRKALEGCEIIEDEGGNCDACGDVRFVPCETCSGSCKILYEVDEEEDEERYEESEFGFQRCPHCNENGLIRCPICC